MMSSECDESWIFKETDFKKILSRIYAHRKVRNPRYSLRALSRDLGISAQRLSEVLNGEHGMSVSTARKMAEKLGFNEAESDYFCDLLTSIHGRSEVERAAATERVHKVRSHSRYRKITADAFDILSEWYYLALLELVDIHGGQSTVDVLSEELDLNVTTVEQAIAKLESFGFLSLQDGAVKRIETPLLFSSETPSTKIREFHVQILQRAILAIGGFGSDQRASRSAVISFSPGDFAAAKADINRFDEAFTGRFESRSPDAEVYCLSVQLFPMTQRNKKA